MESRLLLQAKKDLPLYFDDFKKFWDSSSKFFNDRDLTDCYATTLIFKNWLLALNHLGVNNLNSILNELHEDINSSFFHAYFGQYRSSHMHLRSVIELSLQLIYFYQHEVEFEQWKLGEFRIKHEELTKYLKKHPNLSTDKLGILIDNITSNWKLFSKYIHAEAPNYFQTNLQSFQTKKISKADFGVWKSNYLKTGYQINKLFLFFFRSKLNLFPTANRELLLRFLIQTDLNLLGLKSA